MDDIKLFAKNEKELETIIHTVRIYSWDIGMEFVIEKCAMLVRKSCKRQLNDGMELPNQEKIETLEENETYKYLGIPEADTIKQVEMKEKVQKEYLRRTRKLLETKLICRNLIKGINTWAVLLVRHSEPFLKWTRDELKQMEQRTRKLMTMQQMGDSRYSYISRTLLSTLAFLNNSVIWIVSTRDLISNSFIPFTKTLVTVLSTTITIGISVTFMFHTFFIYLDMSRYLSLFSIYFNFTRWCSRTAKSTNRQVLCFVLTITRSGHLTEIR